MTLGIVPDRHGQYRAQLRTSFQVPRRTRPPASAPLLTRRPRHRPLSSTASLSNRSSRNRRQRRATPRRHTPPRRLSIAGTRSASPTPSPPEGTTRPSGQRVASIAPLSICAGLGQGSHRTANPRSRISRDDHDFIIFLTERATTNDEPRCVLYFEVADVDIEHERLIDSDVEVVHAPRENPWGYGPEFVTQTAMPSGYGTRGA